MKFEHNTAQAESWAMLKVIEGIEIEPIKAGFLALSPRWGIAATGPSSAEAALQLARGVELFERLAARVRAQSGIAGASYFP
jgi:hypothetical protein